MCGRYAVTTDPAKLAAEIDARNEIDPPPSGSSRSAGESSRSADESSRSPSAVEGNFNVAPTTTVMTVVDRHEHGVPDDIAARRIRAMRWGLVPSWTKELGKGPLLINARAESLAEKPAFRTSLKGKRCLVPMDGWYEWRKGPAGADGKPTKTPFFMSPEDGTRLFMGGLWAAWRPAEARAAGDDSAWVSSMTIITTDAVGALRDVHDRMPLIMPFEFWDAWLDPDSPADPALLRPPSADLVDRISVREVSPLVNRVSNNGPELLDPVS
ncbi:SOS response-associated peptidase [Gordonia spumicola]|uniref:SOS response-associated peptidase n=1 Tax=Gordonia spumicola TaxID=589161 RepID=UPI00137A6EE0|nr:SOS response-associated peptidase [Gordonia spumicola]